MMIKPVMTTLVMGALVLALAACGVRYERMTTTPPPQGDRFVDHLNREYRDLAHFEAEKMYDYADADGYAQKVFDLDAGETFAPDEISSRDIAPEFQAELRTARSRLVALLPRARTQTPREAAIAQAKFDCWLEQQEEGFQFDHIAECKRAFQVALRALEGAMATAQQELQATTAASAQVEKTVSTVNYPKRYILFYDFNSARLNRDALTVVELSVTAFRALNARAIQVIGHTDTSGSDAYNQALSLERAKSVKQALVNAGLEQDDITIEGRGESSLLIATPDGTRNESNRRVEIQLRQ
ncbi:MAG: OmpA family protein [Pseudomonadota bacterium]